MPMEQYPELQQIDESTLQNLLSDPSATSIIPEVPEELVTALIISFILLNVLAIAFFIFYIINAIRKWKVQNAVLHMQQDVAEIKNALIKPTEPPVQPEPTPPEEPRKVEVTSSE